jgi:hypothetical protein
MSEFYGGETFRILQPVSVVNTGAGESRQKKLFPIMGKYIDAVLVDLYYSGGYVFIRQPAQTDILNPSYPRGFMAEHQKIIRYLVSGITPAVIIHNRLQRMGLP